jgi:hypothetical protein
MKKTSTLQDLEHPANPRAASLYIEGDSIVTDFPTAENCIVQMRVAISKKFVGDCGQQAILRREKRRTFIHYSLAYAWNRVKMRRPETTNCIYRPGFLPWFRATDWIRAVVRKRPNPFLRQRMAKIVEVWI